MCPFWACIYVCAFDILRVGLVAFPQVYKDPFMRLFSCDSTSQQMIRQHADMATSLLTHRQITFLKDTLRDARRGNQMEPGKSCAVFYSPSAIIQLDSLFLLWCVKCCARIYKNLVVRQMFELQKCEKCKLSLSVCLYDHNTWVLYSPHQSQ